MTNQVDSAKFANQQHKIPLPGQVWRHYAGQEVKVEAIEYSRLAIGEGAVIIFRNKNVKSAHEIPEDSVLVVYSYANGDLWARSMADFLAIIGETTMFNRFDLMFDPRVKRGQEGFTILELAVVVVIISILAAIALPSFLNASARARQAGGVLTVGNLNKAQQSFYLENSRFALTLEELAIGIPATTNDYEYSSVGTNSGATSRAVSQASLPDGSSLQGFVGAVQLSTNASGAVQSLSIICASAAGVEAVPPAAGVDLEDPDACGTGQTRQ